MSKLIDLSHKIVNSMPVYPDDDAVNLYQDKRLEVDGYNNFKLESGMHVGTHIDAPMHMSSNGRYINEIPLDRFIGKGVLLDVRGEKIIRYKEEYDRRVDEGQIVLLFTGHDGEYGRDEYFTDHPVIDRELADFFVRKKIKVLGMDIPSPDIYPFEIHKILFASDVCIIENMTNLSELLEIDNLEIIALPLKIEGDASLLRVVGRSVSYE